MNIIRIMQLLFGEDSSVQHASLDVRIEDLAQVFPFDSER